MLKLYRMQQVKQFIENLKSTERNYLNPKP